MSELEKMAEDTNREPLPDSQMSSKPLPSAVRKQKSAPKVDTKRKELPPIEHEENVIRIGDDYIEIKPTKLKYQRDRTAAFYRIIEVYPLPDILAMEAGVLDAERDGDKCLFDFCIAVTDSVPFVIAHYDDFDSDIIEKMVEIFRRLNKIDDKEEKAKNRAAKEMSN